MMKVKVKKEKVLPVNMALVKVDLDQQSSSDEEDELLSYLEKSEAVKVKNTSSVVNEMNEELTKEMPYVSRFMGMFQKKTGPEDQHTKQKNDETDTTSERNNQTREILDDWGIVSMGDWPDAKPVDYVGGIKISEDNVSCSRTLDLGEQNVQQDVQCDLDGLHTDSNLFVGENVVITVENEDNINTHNEGSRHSGIPKEKLQYLESTSGKSRTVGPINKVSLLNKLEFTGNARDQVEISQTETKLCRNELSSTSVDMNFNMPVGYTSEVKKAELEPEIVITPELQHDEIEKERFFLLSEKDLLCLCESIKGNCPEKTDIITCSLGVTQGQSGQHMETGRDSNISNATNNHLLGTPLVQNNNRRGSSLPIADSINTVNCNPITYPSMNEQILNGNREILSSNDSSFITTNKNGMHTSVLPAAAKCDSGIEQRSYVLQQGEHVPDCEESNFEIVYVTLDNGKIVHSKTLNSSEKIVESIIPESTSNSQKSESSIKSESGNYPGLEIPGRFVRRDSKLVFERFKVDGKTEPYSDFNTYVDVLPEESPVFEYFESDTENSMCEYEDCQLYAYPVTDTSVSPTEFEKTDTDFQKSTRNIPRKRHKRVPGPSFDFKIFKIKSTGALIPVDDSGKPLRLPVKSTGALTPVNDSGKHLPVKSREALMSVNDSGKPLPVKSTGASMPVDDSGKHLPIPVCQKSENTNTSKAYWDNFVQRVLSTEENKRVLKQKAEKKGAAKLNSSKDSMKLKLKGSITKENLNEDNKKTDTNEDKRKETSNQTAKQRVIKTKSGPLREDSKSEESIKKRITKTKRKSMEESSTRKTKDTKTEHKTKVKAIEEAIKMGVMEAKSKSTEDKLKMKSKGKSNQKTDKKKTTETKNKSLEKSFKMKFKEENSKVESMSDGVKLHLKEDSTETLPEAEYTGIKSKIATKSKSNESSAKLKSNEHNSQRRLAKGSSKTKLVSDTKLCKIASEDENEKVESKDVLNIQQKFTVKNLNPMDNENRLNSEVKESLNTRWKLFKPTHSKRGRKVKKFNNFSDETVTDKLKTESNKRSKDNINDGMRTKGQIQADCDIQNDIDYEDHDSGHDDGTDDIDDLSEYFVQQRKQKAKVESVEVQTSLGDNSENEDELMKHQHEKTKPCRNASVKQNNRSTSNGGLSRSKEMISDCGNIKKQLKRKITHDLKDLAVSPLKCRKKNKTVPSDRKTKGTTDDNTKLTKQSGTVKPKSKRVSWKEETSNKTGKQNERNISMIDRKNTSEHITCQKSSVGKSKQKTSVADRKNKSSSKAASDSTKQVHIKTLKVVKHTTIITRRTKHANLQNDTDSTEKVAMTKLKSARKIIPTASDAAVLDDGHEHSNDSIHNDKGKLDLKIEEHKTPNKRTHRKRKSNTEVEPGEVKEHIPPSKKTSWKRKSDCEMDSSEIQDTRISESGMDIEHADNVIIATGCNKQKMPAKRSYRKQKKNYNEAAKIREHTLDKGVGETLEINKTDEMKNNQSAKKSVRNKRLPKAVNKKDKEKIVMENNDLHLPVKKRKLKLAAAHFEPATHTVGATGTERNETVESMDDNSTVKGAERNEDQCHIETNEKKLLGNIGSKIPAVMQKKGANVERRRKKKLKNGTQESENRLMMHNSETADKEYVRDQDVSNESSNSARKKVKNKIDSKKKLEPNKPVVESEANTETTNSKPDKRKHTPKKLSREKSKESVKDISPTKKDYSKKGKLSVNEETVAKETVPSNKKGVRKDKITKREQLKNEKISPKRNDTLWTKKRMRGPNRQMVEIDNSWKELLSDDENVYDIRQLEKEAVKHINVRKVIKHILKSSSKGSEKMEDSKKSSKRIDSAHVEDKHSSRKNPDGTSTVTKTTLISKKLTEGILKDLRQRNDFGLHKITTKTSPVLASTDTSLLQTPQSSKGQTFTENRCLEIHNSPVKALELDSLKNAGSYKSMDILNQSTKSAKMHSLTASEKMGELNGEQSVLLSTSGTENVSTMSSPVSTKTIPSPISKSVDKLTALLNKAVASKHLHFDSS